MKNIGYGQKPFSHTQTITDIHRHRQTALEKSTIQQIGWMAVCACVCLCVAPVSPAFSQTSMDYYRELSRKSEATVGDAVHVLARYKGYSGHTDMYEELMWLYRQDGIKFRRDMPNLEDKILTKGNAAHMLMQALGIKGWVMQRIFSGSQRYAVREAVFLKLLPPDSTVHQVISGSELMGFMSRALELRGEQER